MSLLQKIDYKGITLNEAIFKISGVRYSEKGKDEEGNKIYILTLDVNSYTTPTKEYDIWQKSYSFDTNIDGLTIENGYILLQSLDEYKDTVYY